MKFYRPAFLLLIIITLMPAVYGKPNNGITDSIAQKIYWYALHKASATLFVHFDKNVYTNKEYIWFTGYLLKSDTKNEVHTLSAALIRNDDRSVLAQGKFVMNSGLSFGNLFVPDSLPTGNYSIICYTDGFINGAPTDVFIQPVTIKSTNSDGFIANLNFLDSLKPGMDNIRVQLKAYTKDITLVKNADVNYYIGNRNNPLKTGKIKTDNFGEATISIPLKQINGENNLFSVDINNGKEVKAFSLQLPVYKKTAIVKFYPEGGNLVEGLPCTVGWEVMDNEGAHQLVKASLYENNKQVQTITTDGYGFGKFAITPSVKSLYYVKLETTDYAKDSSYALPKIVPAGPAINIKNALAEDTLFINLNNKQTGSKWTVLVHDYRSVITTVDITAAGVSMIVKVPLADIAKGLYTVTLLDSIGRPWAERLFFAHFNKKAVVSITTDTSTYTQRQKVEVNFKVTDEAGKPAIGLVSISCAKDNRFETKKMTDIESCTYLKHELSSFAFKNKVMSTDADNKKYLENLLLVKGWRRYTWNELETVEAKDTLQESTPLIFTGNASIPNKPTKKPLEIHLLKNPFFNIIKSDSSGNFVIPTERMIVNQNQYIRLFVEDKNQQKFRVNVNDPYNTTNKRIAAALPFENYYEKLAAQTSETTVLARNEHSNKMLDVKVSTKRDANYAANICGDYVCIANVLNCPNHLYGGTEPVLGMRYHTAKGMTSYLGCVGMKYLSQVDGIYTKKDFYLPDYSSESATDNLAEEQLASTIYWNYSLLTNKDGEAKFSFYTNDLTGKFRIVVEGITDNAGLINAEQFFEVKTPVEKD